MMRIITLTALFVLSRPVQAGNAGFLPDGKGLIHTDEHSLKIYDLTTSHETSLDWPIDRNWSYPSLAVTHSEIIIAGDQDALAWNPEAKTWRPFWHCQEGMRIDDIAYDPKTHRVMICTHS
ncbi:hypothetical protein JIN85_08230 [Luteolibacter pohnpeiensis]|uniref:Uncharacterized protein n=1 Tax=Luteolibacter pohnpeiensis TaxID=454153 RepID=A0A934VW33_9BACT|nr:hypothetical protein [Luteolibacter pohnpeiensis]MBK1882398.1 hypothetical protein [Luteolibacter pohnpeiensis]